MRWDANPAHRIGSATSSAALVLALCAVACTADRSRGTTDVVVPYDVLLITLDTARADRFSFISDRGPGTPNIDRLAQTGAGFRQAISPVPLTLPAHATLMTGLQPPSHGVRDNGAFRLPDAVTTLAERLQGVEFATAAFVGAEVLDHRYGLDQGFEIYDDAIQESTDASFLYYPERSADRVVDSALAWVETQASGKLFAWVHLFDPHAPYQPPEPERSRYSDPYNGEIAYVDRAVGRLIAGWDALRGGDRTLIVLTADHGEALGEHNEATHGVLVHDATLRIPLVFRAPGLVLQGGSDRQVGLVDVMPTILSLLGLPPGDSIQGQDLTPLFRGDELPPSDRSGYAESLYAHLHHGTAQLRALRDRRFKWVEGATGALYDLVQDPEEDDDIASIRPRLAVEYAQAMRDAIDGFSGARSERLEIDEESRRALESLGYLWTTPSSAGEDTAESQREPQDALVSLARMAAADRLANQGDLEGAQREYEAVMEREPRSVDARIRLAQLFLGAGRAAEGLPWLQQAVDVAPHEMLLHRKLGRTLETTGDFVLALQAYDTGLRLHPTARDLRDGRWRCLNQLGQQETLRQEANAAVDRDPTDGMARYARAIACCAAQDDAGYMAALQRELAELPNDPILGEALHQAREISDRRKP